MKRTDLYKRQIVGHNGSGKSSLAKHINALLAPTEGTVLISGMNTKDEKKIWDIRQQAGMVFQNPDNQIVSAVVEEDVAFGPENLGVPTEKIWEQVNYAPVSYTHLNIVSRMPSDIAGLVTNYVTGASSIGGKFLAIIIIIAVVVGIIAYVVWLQDGVRHIGVQMSQKVQGRRQVGGQQSTIPLKVNTAGVIPIIFASSILQFPVVIASFFGKTPEWTNYLSQSHWCNPAHMKYSIGFVAYIVMIIFLSLIHIW